MATRKKLIIKTKQDLAMILYMMLGTFKIMIPQIIFLVMVALEAIIVTAKNGKPKGKYNAGTHIISWLLVTLLVWWGGFFDIMM